MSFNKLVRDKIPEIISQEGRQPNFEILSDEAYFKELKIKLQEEVNEFLNDNNIEELADIMEVIYALNKYQGKTNEELEKIRLHKRELRGGFDKKIYLRKD